LSVLVNASLMLLYRKLNNSKLIATSCQPEPASVDTLATGVSKGEQRKRL
jgi:hypothetical protein